MVGHLYGEWGKKPENMLEYATNEKSPRHIKTNLPWNFATLELVTVKPKVSILLALAVLIYLAIDQSPPTQVKIASGLHIC